MLSNASAAPAAQQRTSSSQLIVSALPVCLCPVACPLCSAETLAQRCRCTSGRWPFGRQPAVQTRRMWHTRSQTSQSFTWSRWAVKC